MHFPRIVSGLTLLLGLLAATRPAFAAWPHETNSGNVLVCSGQPTSELYPVIASDGAGGAIVAWIDMRFGSYDVYAQRLSATGIPLWSPDGVPVCIAADLQQNLAIVSDGAGGAIIAWQDFRSLTANDIYAQRIDAAGNVQWAADGAPVCTAPNEQTFPTLAPDGASGAIVAWQDFRSGTSNDIYAQHLDAAGAPLWATNGSAISTAAFGQSLPSTASDGTGGAIIAWQDQRGGSNTDIYAQRISGAGVAAWTAGGLAVCTATSEQLNPVAVADGTGGALIGWRDSRTAGTFDIYARRVNAAGLVQWTTDGLAVCTATGDQGAPAIISDGAGGAILAWSDLRAANSHIYAQRISPGGAAQWTAQGVQLCSATGPEVGPTLASDGANGAIVSWAELRTGPANDLYTQRVSAAGATLWGASAVALCTAANDQQFAVSVPDGSGGAIVTWRDLRPGPTYDIYAQRVERFGQLGNPEPTITGVKDVRNDQGGFVKLSWSASYLDADPVYGITDYRIWRSVPQAALASHALLERGVTRDADEAVASGRLLLHAMATTDYAWEIVGTQSAAILPGYSLTIATTGDSVANDNPATAFMVEARASAAISSSRWFSAPDSGYSVDNLAPATPAPFTGQFAAGVMHLHWNRNTEADLAGYRLYRGTAPGFVPGAGTLFAALADTGYTDAAGGAYVYKLTAVDAHGNESPVATLLPGSTTAVGGGPSPSLSFAPPTPNPARTGTTLEFTLSRPGHVRLAVFDAAGRRVGMLLDGAMPAGPHRESFALCDDSGRGLASGLYLLRLEAEGQVLTRRLAAIR